MIRTLSYAAVAAIGLAGSASALTFNYASTVAGAYLTATVSIDFVSQNGTEWTYDVSVSNTTVSSQPGTNRLTNFGFYTSTDSSGVGGSDTSSIFTIVTNNLNVPNALPDADICLNANNANNCSGGAGGGLVEAGAGTSTDAFSIKVTSVLAPIFTGGFVRYQSVGTTLTSTAFVNCDGVCPPPSPGPNPPAVPLPASLPLLAAGLGLAGFFRRKRRA